jgi:hypothetical protein
VFLGLTKIYSQFYFHSIFEPSDDFKLTATFIPLNENLLSLSATRKISSKSIEIHVGVPQANETTFGLQNCCYLAADNVNAVAIIYYILSHLVALRKKFFKQYHC